MVTVLRQWNITAWQRISAEAAVKGFKKCCISSALGASDDDCCGMTVKRIRMLAVSVRKLKALTVKMEIVTLIGSSRRNLTCFMYYVYETNSKIFSHSRCSCLWGHLAFG